MSSSFRCSECDYRASKWFGRCPECGRWGCVDDSPLPEAGLVVSSLLDAETTVRRTTTGMAELDRVLGGGLVSGAVILLAGEPGIGKSTLILQLIDKVMACGHRTLLITGEESLGQVGLRGARLGVRLEAFRAATTTSLSSLIKALEEDRPDLLVIDSVQTLASDDVDQAAGSTTQVRECAAAIVRYAKATGTVVVLVGHITKEGTVAGPKTLEHMVDVVVTLEGDRTGSVRLLRAAKNRFGSCDETGVFLMSERGLVDVEDPSAMLLADRPSDVPGSVVFPSLEGTRPVLVEIQALVSSGDPAAARRVAIGLENRRLTLLCGILGRRLQLPLGNNDVFVAAAGGIAVREPAADLAIALAITSVVTNRRIPADVVAVGELGLGGEVRRVPGLERRLSEAARLGFRRAVIPRGVDRTAMGDGTLIVRDLPSALRVLEGKPHRPRSVQVNGSSPDGSTACYS
jgi:DNA repair protein RadA/Sms